MRYHHRMFGVMLLTNIGSVVLLNAQTPDRGIVEVGAASSSSPRASAERAGFYATIGLGDGVERYRFSDEHHWTEALSKPTLSVRIGGTPNARTRLGGELFTWRNSIDGGHESFTTYMMTGQFYIGRRGGLHVRGGAGFARSGTAYDDGSSVFETGFGYSFGIGLEMKAGRNLFVTPAIDWYQGSFTKRDEPTLMEHVMNIGVQLSLQSGNKR